MSRKDSQRRRGHNFRYVALHQKYVSDNSDGILKSDYQNASNNPVFCDKRAVLSQDLIAIGKKRVSVEFNVQTRFSTNFNLLDRLIFLETDRENYTADHLLAIQTMRDKSGRREYLDIKAESGAYAGQVGVQPVFDNLLTIKMTAFNIRSIQNAEGSLADMALALAFGPADLILRGSTYKNPFLMQPGEGARPAVLVPSSVASVKATLDRQEHNFAEIAVPDKPLKVFQAPAGVGDDTKIQQWELVYE